MIELPATWPRTIAIWLAYFWRLVLFGGIASLVLVLPFKFVVAHFAPNTTPAVLTLLMDTGNLLVSLVFGPIAFRLVLATKFAGYRIALVEDPLTNVGAGRER